MHYHFGTKEDLVLAVLDRLGPRNGSPSERPEDPIERLHTFLATDFEDAEGSFAIPILVFRCRVVRNERIRARLQEVREEMLKEMAVAGSSACRITDRWVHV